MGVSVTEEKPKWVKIQGRIVDVSSFRHPGGNIIENFYGLDGTTAFEEFHGHNMEKVSKTLGLLPERKMEATGLTQQTELHTKVMTELQASWRERGLYEPRPLSGALYGLVVVAWIVFSVAGAAHAPVLCGLLVGAAWAQCGFLQHMGGHREWGRKYSFFFQDFFEGVCKGGSASWWRGRHNKHHAKTNVIGEDGDLRTTPFFAWDSTLAKRVPNWALKTQAFTFIPALGAYVFIFAFTVRKYSVVKGMWKEVALMLAHYALFIGGLFAAGCSLKQGLCFYLVGYAFQGIYLGFFFALSHFAVDRVPASATWIESSMLGTVDWSGGSAIAGYVSGFLNIQIEHHMAPQMPMENLRQIRADCKEAALKLGLPYREVSFYEAARMLLVGLYTTGREELKLRSQQTSKLAEPLLVS